VGAADLPLLGRRVLVTAPRSYAARLAAQLMERGARPIMMATIITEPLAEGKHAALDAALRELAAGGFVYVAFTSRNGIEAVRRRAEALGLAEGGLAALLSRCVVGALGKDAQLLEEAGVEVALKPAKASPTGLIAELEARGERGKGARILVPVPEVSGVPEPKVVPDFLAGLEELGMTHVRVPAYATRAVLRGNEVEEAMLLAGQVDRARSHCRFVLPLIHFIPDSLTHSVPLFMKRQCDRILQVDALAFSSTAEATALALSLGPDRLAQAASRTAICCFGPITEKNVKLELGLDIDVVAKVRKIPSQPRSWANFSLLQLYSHMNTWATLHLLGQPNAFLAQGLLVLRGLRRRPRRALRRRRWRQGPVALTMPLSLRATTHPLYNRFSRETNCDVC
jgi:uroporphyrinogen-III synthase